VYSCLYQSPDGGGFIIIGYLLIQVGTRVDFVSASTRLLCVA